jgi:hypothetical protein
MEHEFKVGDMYKPVKVDGNAWSPFIITRVNEEAELVEVIVTDFQNQSWKDTYSFSRLQVWIDYNKLCIDHDAMFRKEVGQDIKDTFNGI